MSLQAAIVANIGESTHGSRLRRGYRGNGAAVPENNGIATRLEEAAQILGEQDANPFRIRAYERAAATVRALQQPVSALIATGGVAALDALPGIGARTAARIHDRLGRVRRSFDGAHQELPPVAELLDVDAQYRREAQQGTLKRIVPRRFNPEHEAGLPVLHATHGERQCTVITALRGPLKGRRIVRGCEDECLQYHRPVPAAC